MATEAGWGPSRVFGILCSQIGYAPAGPVRVLIRSDDPSRLKPDGAYYVESILGAVIEHGTFEEAGPCWGSSWWSATLSIPRAEGTYRLGFTTADGATLYSDPFDVRPGILWDTSFERVALDQLERRARFAKAGHGWMDAGMPWQEANAHGSMLIGLLDILEAVPERLSTTQRERLHEQIVVGCDYLALLQDTAAERGHPSGSLSHMTPDYEDDILPADASKAAVAWAMAARLMPDGIGLNRADARRRAALALSYAASDSAHADPSHLTLGFNHHQRGLDASYSPPVGQPTTREIWAMAWAGIELARQGDAAWDRAVGWVDRALDRQATQAEAIDGLHGYFFEFDDRHHAEPAWAHQIKSRPLGVDAGATFPNWVLPLVLLLRHQPYHPKAYRWRQAVHQFAYGYLLPACQHNPFFLLPNLLHRKQGLIYFAGPWHGMSCIYTLTAAVSMELYRVLDDDSFLELATGNLQWVAGLNAGLTRESLRGCHMFDTEVPEGIAWPVSLIHKVRRQLD